MTTTPSPEPLAPDAPASREEWWICRTCAVEHAERPDVCAICADERQWVPATGQAWTTLAELAAAGERLVLEELEPDLFGLSSEPSVGIGQQAKIVRTPAGNLLWDPPGYVDDDAVEQVRALGPVVAIAASHPHMFGVQVAWSRALGGVPVLVAEADAHWVARPDPVIETWTGERELLPGVVLSQPGGHFPGSAVVHWAAGAEGRGVLLSGDTIFANPDRTSVSFMRSYPNRIPLSAAVVLRVAEHVARRPFERLYNNFEGVVPADARQVVLRSAQRHAAWVRGDFDHLT
ncbi:MBL fold metallo-hydrolase [Cellulosimicrobium cellulans]|uniref:MBL fold metallo-hydrolase n=1 Tax=Cellulosimicrobium cellulans TaxID=1710 RepID=UPI002097C904|nr:MBL fold metallo-hydrolase [Cellulosimicrobium cellulans]MCO7273494.1 MBL fold metallo-hydrolase [Cellulosimicrobium cellulans]